MQDYTDELLDMMAEEYEYEPDYYEDDAEEL